MTDNNEIFDLTDISLLYPDDKSRLYHENSNSESLSEYTADQLELYQLMDLAGCSIGDFFTSDKEVIIYRQETFRDLAEHPELTELLNKMIPLLNDITELRRIGSDPAFSAEAYLYSITEVELYSSLLEMMKTTLENISPSLNSRAFIRIAERIHVLTESDYYKNINRKLNELTSRVREVKSITIGVNLNSQLRADTAGVLAVNNESFKSGQLIDKILRLDFKKDDMTCIAPLIPFRREQSENQQLALSYALNAALNDVFRSSIRSWKKVIQSYILENTDFLIRMIPEIEFVTKAADLIKKLKEKECPLCIPEIAGKDEKKFTVTGLCNPVVAIKLDSKVIPNDFKFDENGMIYILTGPNRGGKSVITCAVGIAFAMAQLGLPVCAESCLISPCDKIFTHFPQGSEDTIDKGRLGEECSRLESIFSDITDKSLVLLDESFSSTGAYEASFIAGEVVAGFSIVGCRGVFSTHLHDLAAKTDELNYKCSQFGGVKIDNLSAEANGSERSFRIIRKAPDGRSYANDIAQKYGLSFESLMKRIKKG